MSKHILPWQHAIWHELTQRRKQNRMPHALLFSGTSGVGKMQLAEVLGCAMLCKSPDADGFACGHCKSCSLTLANSHPDFMKIAPDEKGNSIKIDQIREVVQFVNETALLGGHRVIIINPATAMNVNAANALLKTLEEPSADTLIILIANQSLRLPATISSRCQRINFHKPEKKAALLWLQSQQQSDMDAELLLELAEGAPIKAKELMENDLLALRKDLYQSLLELSQRQGDPLQKANALQDQNLPVLFHWLLLWLKDLLRCKLTDNQVDVINQDKRNELSQLAQKISLEKLLGFADYVQQVYAQVTGALNLNKLMLVEETFIKWKLCF